ncbi:hypothetical protein ASD52_04000 [Ensifer sp. Root142]|uniref:NAD-dependent epimerase/dehydratase family protein n=1 Tax=Ensifer sp. Root142 TaxID=1736461 RepID=UPI00070F006A|nr:NAD(P)-dependent oxidoreductase [Ensifer sp. Root142]KQY78993.1 hypothetical protein ASD52_04000 [Ensifer sp. Root142]MDP9632153.1 nucleoside-diphosphate-sugar epimerase [Ensifer adhaerens]
MQRVIVTGANGFVGKSMPTSLIRRGCQVYSLGRTDPKVDGVSFHQMDLLDSDADEFRRVAAIGADTMIHVAWCTEPGVYWTSIDNLRWMAASLRLLDAFLAGGGKRVIIAGTCAEYDWNFHTLTERETPLAPSTIYGQAKASLHATVNAYAQKHSISFAWAHIFFPYGPGEKRRRLLSDLVCNLLDGLPMDVSDGKQIRDFMHVDDVADAIIELAASDVQGPVNIASGEPRQLREIIELTAKEVGRRDLVRLGARPPLANDPPCLAASVLRLRNEVGFRPRYTLEDGISATVAWWRSNLTNEAIRR